LAISEEYELLDAVSEDAGRLMQEHRERREHWYAHEYVPWEQGRNYVDEPWDESQCTLSPEARTSLVLNLLTEDNLPYYHAVIERNLGTEGIFGEWNRLWTAEEGQHAIALRSYLLTSRNCDPKELEDDRYATMETGFDMAIGNPAEIFVYTAAQELATRVSHRNAGRITDDETAYQIMQRIAADENHHFLFYRGMVSAMLREAPSAVLPAIHDVLVNFRMPGVGIPNYMRRAVDMARAGVYNLRIHHDRVLTPLLRDWKIESLTGLTVRAEEVQEKIMKIPELVSRRADAFDRRFGLAST
jgi:acyl-[acyl-carrier-protein] desaturase